MAQGCNHCAAGNKGFVHVGENARYLKVGNEPFFPVGQNLTGPNKTTLTSEWAAHPVEAYIYDIFKGQMTELAANGANYFRYIASPWQTEIEFEHLGNYSNRMTNAWEFDKILDTAKALDLKMHFNMAMHYTFERPSRYAMTFWDWTAKGDTLSPHPMFPADAACWHDNDSGYCYRRELDIVNPIDFFSDSTAMSFYKKRLRYMVARWGYSTEIGVMELLSEANNVGSEHIINYRLVSGEGGCYYLKNEDDSLGLNSVLHYPYKDEAIAPTFVPNLCAWQIEMCRYIKEDLGHHEHPTAVDYTGLPDFSTGDSTYFSEYIDIANYNNYQLAINKNEQTYKTIEEYLRIGYGLAKPIMNSESGTGSNVYLCDNNATVIQLICLSPFTGLAGVGMSWDAHFNEQDFWHYLGNVNEFMEGIPLGAENWYPGEPLVAPDKSTEILYLRSGIATGADTKIAGAISNRSFNYFTSGFGDTTYDCRKITPELVNNHIYQVSINHTNSYLDNDMKIKYLGANNDFVIDWYNALTGEYDTTIYQSSSTYGNLILEFPGELTWDFESPILFFKMYPYGDTFLSPLAPNDFTNLQDPEFQLAEDLDPIDPTPWTDSLNTAAISITISPNPTNGIISCSIHGDFTNLNWILINATGQQILENKIISPNLSIDLSVYSSGNYYLKILDEKGQLVETLKIIKL